MGVIDRVHTLLRGFFILPGTLGFVNAGGDPSDVRAQARPDIRDERFSVVELTAGGGGTTPGCRRPSSRHRLRALDRLRSRFLLDRLKMRWLWRCDRVSRSAPSEPGQ